jgi:Glycosyl transferase family 2
VGVGRVEVSATLTPPALRTSALGHPARSPTILSAGIVAHNEERNLERSVRSLLDQELPSGVWWNSLWIVASGCTDRTVEIAQQLSEEDLRVRLVVEPDRRGKAHALREVFRRAQGNALVLLNADASAEPGSVAELVRIASAYPAPYAVMGRPVVPPDAPSPWDGMLRSMWDLHHSFHCELQELGGGSHLSDELLLVSLPTLPPLPDGIINDGSYFAVWLAQHGGHRLYAPEARVRIEIPARMRDHLHQRRRIQYGNDQVTAVLGAPPSTLARYALSRPKRAMEMIRGSVLSQRSGLRRFAQLGAAEAAAKALALWDRVPPRKDHVRWRRIQATAYRPIMDPPSTIPEAPYGTERRGHVEQRVAMLLETARHFGTGLDLADLVQLLPREGPATTEEVRRWFADRPGMGRIEGDRVYSPACPPTSSEARRERGLRYRAFAKEVVERRLGGALRWVRCLGISGSTAYGEPEAGDDLDFLVVTRTGATWLFLAYTYLTLRLRTRVGSEPELCFNYVLDDLQAPREFARGQGFLFAREALMAGIVWGEEYYRHLLSSAPWMVEEIPRMFDGRTVGAGPRPPPRLPVVWRCLNGALYPLLAAYLELVGLRRNHWLRRQGRSEAVFRTEVSPHRLAFVSRRFERLRQGYAQTPSGVANSGGAMTSHLSTNR